MRIKENLLFQRNLGNSCSRSLRGAVMGQWKRHEWIECLPPGQKRHRASCPWAQGPSRACPLHGTSFTDLRSCLDLRAHQRGGLALERSRRSRTVWMQKRGSGRKQMGNCVNSYSAPRTVSPITQRVFNARAITHAWYMPPPSHTSTSLTLTAPRFSGTLPSRLSRGCEHPVTPSYYQP